MDRIKLSLVFVALMAISWGMVVTGTASDPFLEIGPLSLTFPYILGYGSLLMLVNLWTHILTKFTKFMMSGWFTKITFAMIIIFGILALIDFTLNSLFGIEIGIISRIGGLWN